MMPSRLTQCFHHRVRLRPAARRFRGVTELRIVDDDWLVQEIEKDVGVSLRNIRTDHIALLAFDQIRSYLADPKREFDGLRHGFLNLRVQIYLRGDKLVIEPYGRPARSPKAKAPAANTPEKKSE